MSNDLSINPTETTEYLVNFIKSTLRKTGFSKLVLGLSGGIDSATSLALGVSALGADNIYVGSFPYGDLNKEGQADAELLVQTLNIPQKNITTIDIKPLVDPIIKATSSSGDLRRGNIMVRMRMILLYDLSKKFDALVLGTENKTEHLLGYFTRFGDEASDLEPIINLYKTQVKQLASYLKIPDKIVRKAPTAGMWLGQTDEKEFGFTYEEADQVLHLYFDKNLPINEIIKAGFSKGLVDKILKRAKENEFKQKLPYAPS